MSSLAEDLSRRGRLSIVSRLGEGGMGVVYEALDLRQGERVALKTLRAVSPDGLLRFKREFRALADLSHPNLVRLGELFEVGGQWMFTMELVDGVDFLSWVRGAAAADDAPPTEEISQARDITPPPTLVGVPFDEARLRAAFGQLARGLDALHAAAMVHRDIKPPNVRVTRDGRVVLLDFGLVTETAGPVPDEALFGTVSYMAPEQAAGARVGPQADWYAAGTMLFEALTGRVPFVGKPMDVLVEKQRREPPPPSSLAPGVPADLERLCLELLAFDPDARQRAQRTLESVLPEEAARRRLVASHTTVSLHGSAPFVGRAAERAALHRALAARRALTVVVQGDSGVGKTALVRAFSDEAAREGALILSGHCRAQESVPFKAFDGVVDALAHHLSPPGGAEAPGRAAALLPPDVALLADVFPVLRRVRAIAEAPHPAHSIADPVEERLRVFGALRALLRRLAERRPLVLTVDGLQWADRDSLALFAAIMRAPEAPAVLLVFTARPGELPALPGEVREIALGVLPADEATDLAGRLLTRLGEPADRAAAIAATAAGHPLFIDELVRAGEARAAQLDDALWARAEALDEPARRLLHLVAVAGRPHPLAVLAHASGRSPAELGRLVAHLGILHLARTLGDQPACVEPYHDRVREAVQARLPEAQRRAYHEALAFAIEAHAADDAESLAVHWEGAGNLERAARHAIVAAERATAALAFDRAAALLGHALQLRPPPQDEEATLRAQLGDALANAGRGMQAAAAYLEAAALGSGSRALELRRRAAEQLLRAGHIDEGMAALRTVLGAVGMRIPGSPRRALASLLAGRAHMRLRGMRFSRREAGELPAADLTRVDVCWSAAATLSMADHLHGAHLQTRHYLLALEAGEPMRVARALAVEAMYLSTTLRPGSERTATMLSRAIALSDELGDPYTQALCRGTAGIRAFQEGRFVDALPMVQDAERSFRDRCSGVAWEVTTAQLFCIFCAFYLGDPEALCERVLRHLEAAEARGDLYASVNLRLGLPNAAWLLKGEPAEARRHATAALERWSPVGFHLQHYWSLLALTNVDLYEGRGADAWARVATAWPALERSLLLRVRSVRVEALAMRGRAALAAAAADESQRAALVHEADRAARALGAERYPFPAVMAQLLRAGVLRQRGKEAVPALDAAREMLASLSMGLYAAAATHRLAALTGRGRSWPPSDAATNAFSGVRDVEAMTRLLVPGLE